ncbi:3-dehydroquinate synthase [Tessaracoccus oleiagri]|uniref:3-dehydroquinate synthase n=1 Tax=Tessaracoccus oleiagri TaxID=686624 RepID=A0A1G9MBJ3_9ACTN|nr:3-dehydroquinate synthase [Tessaracoccus oleiagri]SDL71579.1 3-dehydroquinate synthase [Tessaracoccus oleiagri]
MTTVHVPSQLGPYDVHLGHGALERLPALVGDAGRVAVIHPESLPRLADEVAALVDAPVLRVAVPDAEAAKTADVLATCWSRLAEAGFTRNDLVVGIGGGTTTDLAGFVAATWLRGVRYVSVPTTVLAMVDAAVGGKTGINLPAGKNLVGAFYEPAGVICDFRLLESLPGADLRAGFAEIIKCGFIADPAILDLADRDDRLEPGSLTFAELVRRAVAVKAAVVAADLREATSSGDRVGREALNYGHTLGHAIEAHAGYTWRHGEAISVGMAWIARVSRSLLGLADEVVAQHDELLSDLGLPLRYPGADYASLRAIMSLDKKARGNTLRLVGLRAVGRPTIIAGADERVLESAYRELG